MNLKEDSPPGLLTVGMAVITIVPEANATMSSEDGQSICANVATLSSSHSKPFANILKTFFSLAYKICFAPFEILEGPDGQFYANQWWPQQIICALGSISSIFYRVLEIQVDLPKGKDEWNPALYFKLFHKILNLIFNLNIWIAMWFMKHKFVTIIQYFHTRMKHDSLQSLQRKLSRLIVVMGALNTMSVTVYFLFGTDILPKSEWSPVVLFKCFAARARKLSFCVERFDCDDIDDIYLSVKDIILATAFSLCRFLRKLMGLSEELFVLVVPLTLWAAVKDFVTRLVTLKKGDDALERHEHLCWEHVSKRYADLNELNDLINKTFGPILLSYTLTALFYFSINLDDFLMAEDTLVKYKFFIYYIFIISTFTISAEIVRQIGKLVPWISNNLHDSLTDMSHRELTLILHEISSNRIGMSACGLFTVTYSVVAQMTGVFVTYFIIMVQYRENKVVT